jgi:preprotein translocase subunit SecA
MATIWGDFARMIYNVEVQIEGEDGADAIPAQAPGAGRPASLAYSGGTLEDQPSVYGGAGDEVADEELPVPVQQRRVETNEQLGRNEPCWCGSGKKFKKCHGAGV